MFDEDLASLYQVDTGLLNRAVKRSIDRFPADFMFQLTKTEYDTLRCQFGISKIDDTTDRRGGRRYLPYAFTEQGIAMLSSVLRSNMAVKVSVGIMRAFVEMRKFITNNALLFERISTSPIRSIH
jgi:metal-dependent HD superfamily phosphatase/phosphodiesterase